MLNGFSYGKIHPRHPPFTCFLMVITRETGQSLAALKSSVSPTLRDGQCQGGGIFGRMVDRISANLARNKIVCPQHVDYGRISVDDLEPHTATFFESVRHRFDADIESVDFAGLDRFRIGMGVIRLHLGAFLWVEGTMPGAQPPFRDPAISRIETL